MSDVSVAAFIQQELEKLPVERGLQKKTKDTWWIRCPYHADGKEKTGSLQINVDGEYVGGWRCFGCFTKVNDRPEPKRGKWAELAGTLGLKGGKKQDVETIIVPSFSATLRLLDEEDVDGRNKVARELVKKSLRFPKEETWRGIKGWLLRDIGARVVFNEHGSHVYLPVKMGTEWTSGIYCTWEKEKLSYINEADPRIKRSLFPYNYVRKLCKNQTQKYRYVVLCEGPRDALNLIQNGIPALAVLGGVTVWTKEKAEAVAEINPRLVIFAFDPDPVGKALTKVAGQDLLEYNFLMKVFKMKITSKKGSDRVFKEDPGNLSEMRMKQLKRGAAKTLKTTVS